MEWGLLLPWYQSNVTVYPPWHTRELHVKNNSFCSLQCITLSCRCFPGIASSCNFFLLSMLFDSQTSVSPNCSVEGFFFFPGKEHQYPHFKIHHHLRLSTALDIQGTSEVVSHPRSHRGCCTAVHEETTPWARISADSVATGNNKTFMFLTNTHTTTTKTNETNKRPRSS